MGHFFLEYLIDSVFTERFRHHVLYTKVEQDGIFFSGDNDLIQVSGYAGIQVLTPKAFVSEFLGPEDKKRPQ